MRDLILIEHLQIWPEDLGKMTWVEATARVAKLGPGWRLPTLAEFKKTLYLDRSGIPDIDTDYYWSSTENPYYSDLAWTFSLYNGYPSSYSKEHSYLVRAVRDFTGEVALDMLLKEF